MNEICVNIITRTELKDKKVLLRLLEVILKERQEMKFNKYSFFEPINMSFNKEVLSEIASTNNFCILLKDSRMAVTGSIWMNNRVCSIFFESKKWNETIKNDLWQLTKDLSQVINIDFAFLDILTSHVILNGQKIGAVTKTNRMRDDYTYSLFQRNLSFGIPDTYHFMLINKKMLNNAESCISELSSIYLVNDLDDYIECQLSEKLGSEQKEIVSKKEIAYKILNSSFNAAEWIS